MSDRPRCREAPQPLVAMFLDDWCNCGPLCKVKAPLAELDPHAYVPSTLHMGDCAVCGHRQGSAIHSPFRRHT